MTKKEGGREKEEKIQGRDSTHRLPGRFDATKTGFTLKTTTGIWRKRYREKDKRGNHVFHVYPQAGRNLQGAEKEQGKK